MHQLTFQKTGSKTYTPHPTDKRQDNPLFEPIPHHPMLGPCVRACVELALRHSDPDIRDRRLKIVLSTFFGGAHGC